MILEETYQDNLKPGAVGQLAFIDTLTQTKMKLWDGHIKTLKPPSQESKQV